MLEKIKFKEVKFSFNFSNLLTVVLLVSILIVPVFVRAEGVKKSQKLKVIGPCNMSGGTIFKPGQMAVAMKYLYFEKDQLYDGNDEVSGTYNGKYNREQKVMMLTVRRGISKKFDMRVSIPYYDKTLKRNAFVGKAKETTVKSTVSGIGDINVIGRYSLFSQRDNDPYSLAVGIGVKMPTGDSDKKNPEPFSKKLEYSGPGFQLGTGSWDPKFEIGFTKRYIRSRVDSHLMYTWGNEGDHGLEKGDVLKYDLGYTYAVSKKYDLELELNAVSADKSLNDNKTIEGSGGNTIFLTPGVHYKMQNNYNISLAIPIVVYRDLNADDSNKKYNLGEDYRVVVKMVHMF